MSYHEDSSCSPEEMPSYYDGIGPDWTGALTPEFQAAFLGANASYCTEPIGQPSIPTPVSLPDSSFRPSPAVSHHSQEYGSEYQYGLPTSMAPHGLGISANFPPDFPVSSAQSTSYVYAPDELNDLDYQLEYGLGNPPTTRSTPCTSPGPAPITAQALAPAPKRMKRAPSQQKSKSHTPSRETPVTILPHPEGMERMKRERLNPRPPPLVHPRPRAPGRGRRDPQAEEEDAFVQELREQGVAWRVVRELFRGRFDKDATEARLQMRLTRRREKQNTKWEDHDVQLLIRASEMWEKEKYRFIAEKVKELGATKAYTPNQCKLQLRLIETGQHRENVDSAASSPSAMSDPPNSPQQPQPPPPPPPPPPPAAIPTSRKRARPQSLEPE
ncbi:hypothetical protein N7466_009745 [Penicillium verhagenii]|uniref:uncharacterized protein n=1 Tax=Penicillium verhagenii TaxID=1562060 RepID=UPI00254575F3|nr:uncharacterized protein N7466_009745 [Penicillium verhagenii]KAJ5921419.1 hypothetical protein N7466_009745 [Penicillium verhagenii]